MIKHTTTDTRGILSIIKSNREIDCQSPLQFDYPRDHLASCHNPIPYNRSVLLIRHQSMYT